jgi:hypothetical protein
MTVRVFYPKIISLFKSIEQCFQRIASFNLKPVHSHKNLILQETLVYEHLCIERSYFKQKATYFAINFFNILS